MVVPQIDVDGILRSGLRAPQFPCRETHGGDMLRLFAEKLRVGVGEDEHPVIALNRTELSARVARQPGMTGGVDVARANALAHSELRRRRYISTGRHAVVDEQRGLFC